MQVLNDVKNGKLQNWRGHKLNSLELSESYARLGMLNKSARVYECGSYLTFKKFVDGALKLHQASFCKVRMCPMCGWRRSLKIFGQVSKVMDYMVEHFDYKYIFLTLTAKNVTGELLSEEIDDLFKAFKLLVMRKEFKAVSNGFFRCLEVTHNWERNDYHPHFHVIIAVNKDYVKNSKNYITHAQWRELWKSCLDIDYLPIVNVKEIKSTDGISNKKAVAEVAKYAVKAGDFMMRPAEELKHMKGYVDACNKMTDEAVFIIDSALKNRRLVAMGGQFKKVHKMLNLDDSENGDLVNTNNEDDIERDDLNYVIVNYNWNIGFGNYIKHE